MIRKQSLFFFLLITGLFISRVSGQGVENTGMTDQDDTTDLGTVKIRGYVDTYYGYDFNNPWNSERLFSYSASNTNEIAVNLAYIDIHYETKKVRARFVPAVGSFMNTVYATEPGSLKNIFEAYAGVKISDKRNIWIDVGVMGSPFTNETAISKDHLMYTRSLSCEYAPYYVSGLRLKVPVTSKLNAYFYVVNGWQEISDVNKELCLVTQLEYRPDDKLLLNWNTFTGSEQSTLSPNFRNRYFSDLYAIYNPTKKLSFTSNIDFGQQDVRAGNKVKPTYWGQANLIAQYKFTRKYAVSARYEAFYDPDQVMIQPTVSLPNVKKTGGPTITSTGLCFDTRITTHALFRIEGRHYYSRLGILESSQRKPVQTDDMLITSLCVWF